LYVFCAKFETLRLPWSYAAMTSNRKFALLVGAATCLLAMMYAAPIFGADETVLSEQIEPIITAQDFPDIDDAFMIPVRAQASAALARLQAAETRP
jgi:hypothetical protein